jgi:hypothetical protein
MILNIAGLLLLMVQYNAMFSLMEIKQARVQIQIEKVVMDSLALDSSIRKTTDTSAIKAIQLQMAVRASEKDSLSRLQPNLDELAKKLEYYTAPVLGFSYSAYDVTIIAGICMVILGYWFFYSLRRENHVLIQIVYEANKISQVEGTIAKRLIEYLYLGVVHMFVFVTSDDEQPIATSNSIHLPSAGSVGRAPRTINKLLHYTPIVVPLLLILTDGVSLFMPSIYEVGGHTPFAAWHFDQWLEFAIREGFAAFMIAICFWLTAGAIRLTDSTRGSLQVLRRIWMGELPPVEHLDLPFLLSSNAESENRGR